MGVERAVRECREYRTVLACHPLDIIRESGFYVFRNLPGHFTCLHENNDGTFLIVKSKASLPLFEWPNGKSLQEKEQQSLSWHLGRLTEENTVRDQLTLSGKSSELCAGR